MYFLFKRNFDLFSRLHIISCHYQLGWRSGSALRPLSKWLGVRIPALVNGKNSLASPIPLSALTVGRGISLTAIGCGDTLLKTKKQYHFIYFYLLTYSNQNF